jgi:uncharacterized RDD family membrane protein YckC
MEVSMFCPDCGWKNPDTVSVCDMCGKPLPSRAGRKPEAVAPPVATVRVFSGPPIARLGDRMIAVVLDTILLVTAFAVAGSWAANRWGGVTESGFALAGKPAVVASAVTLLFGFLYTFFLEGAFGATLGKAMAGVQVRMTHGGKCTVGASFLRNLLRIVDALAGYLVGFFIAIFSKQRQRLGDHVADTVVVEADPGTGLKALVVVLWLAGVGGGAYGAYVLHRAAPTPGIGVTIGNVEFLESDGGPIRKAGPFKPGDHVFLRYEVTGYARGAKSLVDIAITAVPYDPAGLALDRPTNLTFHEPVAGNVPIIGRLHFRLPLFVPPGTCKVVIRAEDALGKRSTERSPALTVQGMPTEPATTLEVRDFTFRASEDGAPVAPAVFLAEQPVYYSFGIYGLGFREDKVSLHIAYKLVGPSGEVLVDRPDWQDVNESFFYHPATFYLPLNARVSLAAGVPRGRYTQRHIIEDRINGAKLEYKSAFEIR